MKTGFGQFFGQKKTHFWLVYFASNNLVPPYVSFNTLCCC